VYKVATILNNLCFCLQWNNLCFERSKKWLAERHRQKWVEKRNRKIANFFLMTNAYCTVKYSFYAHLLGGGGVVEKCRKSNQFNAQCSKSFEKMLSEPNNKYNIIYFELVR